MYDLCAGADYILHQAALGSVPRSIVDPLETNASNVGFLNMIEPLVMQRLQGLFTPQAVR